MALTLRVLFFGNGPRGAACLRRVVEAGHLVCGVVAHAGTSASVNVVKEAACAAGLECLQPADPNDSAFVSLAASKNADVFILAGYSPILREPLIDVPSIMAINTHAGELPGMRGSSPLNWALIEGRDSVTLSIIRVSAGVDSGDVLTERVIGVSQNTTIADLQDAANAAFPDMIVRTLESIASGTITWRVQDARRSSYYPLRFPDDGFILWDQLTAAQIHNRIRALTEPYPCAFTFGNGHRIRLIRSEMTDTPVRGEAGRIYRKTTKGLLVCAMDRCLWITQAVDDAGGRPAAELFERYETLATMRDAALRHYESGVSR